MILRIHCRTTYLLIVNLLITVFAFAQSSVLFENDEVLEITLMGDLNSLFKNRYGKAEYFDIHVSYEDSTNQTISIPLRSKTRGKFRRRPGFCKYPPLLLNFNKKSVENTLFKGQDKLKLVMPCRGDKYVLREYYTYKIFNILTDYSFKARLVKVNLEDSNPKARKAEPFYAFIIEEEDQMADRNKMISVGQDLIRPENLDSDEFLKMATFQYLIGNTDWSVQFRQNIKLLKNESSGIMIGVPYDFDHAGIVFAPYAKPAEELNLSNIKERRYRGYCVPNMASFGNVFALFNERKEEIYDIFFSSLLLEERYKKSIVRYLDEFYRTINNPNSVQKEFQYPCDPFGTGNVIIKGLREN